MNPLRLDFCGLEQELVNRELAHSRVSGTGPCIQEFEHALGERLEVGNVIAVANGTLALELALRALGVGPGDEVIVPALTFAAPAMSVVAVGATPVFADVDESDWTLDIRRTERCVTPRTSAVIAVDLIGRTPDYTALARLGIPVIEDAAEAHGASYRGRLTGGLGVVSCFSFFANKNLTTGEGGAVCTDDQQLAERMRLMANHGMSARERYVHRNLGRNFRMTNLQAALGCGQLMRWDEILDARRRVTERYASGLSALGLRTQAVSADCSTPGWIAAFRVDDAAHYVSELRNEDIDARPIWPALTHQPFFENYVQRPCPVAEEIARSAIQLPTSSTMSDAEVDEVLGAVREISERKRTS